MSKRETAYMLHGKLLFSEYATKRELPFWHKPTALPGQLMKSLESTFTPEVWAAMMRLYRKQKPSITIAEGARMCGLSQYKFRKELKRLYNGLEVLVSCF